MEFIPAIIGAGVGSLSFLERTREQQQQVLRNTAELTRDSAAVQERLTGIQNVDDLLNDRQVLRVVLGSFGLESDLDNKGFLRNVLLSDLNDPRSTANRLGEPRYRQLALTFNFASDQSANLPGASARDTLTSQLQALDSVDALFELPNARLLTRALEVFGLEDEAPRTAFLKRVLSSDLSDSTSLANRLGDQRFVDFAKAFQNEVDRLPDVLRGKVSEDVEVKLRAATSGADLVRDRFLLKAVLTQFGLEDQLNNPSLIRDVLDSDLSDPRSLANRLTDSRFQDLTRAFDFAGRRAEASSVYALVERTSQNSDSLLSADLLLADDALLSTALSVFGLDPEDPDKVFLKLILESDPDDAASPLNQEGNETFLAFAKAFDFGEQLARPDPNRESRIERLVEAVESRNRPARTVSEFAADSRLFLAVTNLFDLPQGEGAVQFATRLLQSDPESPVSVFALTRNDNFRHLFNALPFEPENQPRQYPVGFSDAIINSYVERQFEVAIGAQNNDMRLMLALERDLNTAIDQSRTNDTRWLRVIGTPSLRTVFEGAFGLPQSFGQLDVDRQLAEFKDRAERVFGTSELSDFAEGENLDALQRRYLAFSASSAANAGGTSPPANPILSLLV